jgi:hypothetical protein
VRDHKADDIKRVVACPFQHFEALASLVNLPAWEEQEDVVIYLRNMITVGFNFHTTDPRTGMTLMMYYGQQQRQDLMKALIDLDSDHPRAVDFCNRTVLHHTQVVFPELLRSGACDFDATDQWGQSARVSLLTRFMPRCDQIRMDRLRTLMCSLIDCEDDQIKQLARNRVCQLYVYIDPSHRTFHIRWLYLAAQQRDQEELREWAFHQDDQELPLTTAAIHAACESAGMGELEHIQEIIESGADLTVIDDAGMTGLWVRIMHSTSIFLQQTLTL